GPNRQVVHSDGFHSGSSTGRHPRHGGWGLESIGTSQDSTGQRCMSSPTLFLENGAASDLRNDQENRTRWHVLLVSTSRAKSASRSHLPTFSAWVVPARSRHWPRRASTPTLASVTLVTRSWSSFATTSPANSRSRVTSAVRLPPTSAARSRSAATRAFFTVAVFRYAVSAPRPTRAPARVPSAPWPARRRPASSPTRQSRATSDPRSCSDHLPRF